jgi:hypothetical protein
MNRTNLRCNKNNKWILNKEHFDRNQYFFLIDDTFKSRFFYWYDWLLKNI